MNSQLLKPPKQRTTRIIVRLISIEMVVWICWEVLKQCEGIPSTRRFVTQVIYRLGETHIPETCYRIQTWPCHSQSKVILVLLYGCNRKRVFQLFDLHLNTRMKFNEIAMLFWFYGVFKLEKLYSVACISGIQHLK